MTLRSRDGLHLAIHEAALVDYAGMWLRRTEGQHLRAQLSPSAEGWKVRRALPFATPWHTLQIADRAGGLVESDLILSLNGQRAGRCELGEASQVSGRVVVDAPGQRELGDRAKRGHHRQDEEGDRLPLRTASVACWWRLEPGLGRHVGGQWL